LPGEFIRPEDLPETLTERKSAVEPETSGTYHAVLNATKESLIRNALQKTGGDYQAAARLLDVHFTYLYRLARNLNIQ
jgi:transcriptional regulator of acetoin/glycerol metabolism